MLEITIISGKGGTGKTSLTGALAHLARGHVLCDLDVDAPDLHLLLDPDYERDEDFYSGHRAVIAEDRCTGCGDCLARCRFEAIRDEGGRLVVDPIACEGCGVCVHFCPAEAIDFPEEHCGRWYVSSTRFGPMVHAQLFPGQENSGRLVSLLRQEARELAEARGLETIISDGAPGIGCPVISSLSGTSLAVIVTEPTPSGRHDMERVADLAEHFRIPQVVVVNKRDINPDQSRSIEAWCAERRIEVAGRLPYDPDFTRAMVERKVITEFQARGTADEVRAVWARIQEIAGLLKAA
ncbi:MAG: ATP-binding protein [Proteobacteria bacterium]|nr:ATP-binding protein [Pseudomonadota bacterium]